MIQTKNMQQVLTNCEIQLLVIVVMTGPLLSLTTNSSSLDPPLKDRSFTRLPLNDVLFTEDVLLEVSARSRIDCSKKCVETEGCVMCTFLSSPQSPPGHCRLHSQLQNLTNAWQNSTGAKSLARRGCDGGYVQCCDRCLKAVDRTVNYATARQACISMQGRLALPKSQAEVDCMWSFLRRKKLTRARVGGDDMQEPRVFRWNDGTLLPDMSPLWESDDEPDHNNPGGDCLNLREESSAIFDSNCSWDTIQYICQKDFV